MENSAQRLAKAISQAGMASRRKAEKLIEQGRVRVNGQDVSTPATLVNDQDIIEVDGQMLEKPPLRLWLFHKPAGLVCTARDEKGRKTIYEILPSELANVNTIGRLDLTSEGLLLLTNHGGLKRVLELPKTGWRRGYRVRAFGRASEADLDRLRKGMVYEGISYRPAEVKFEREQGQNGWYQVYLKEGKNREIRKLFEAIGLQVNRLIRVSYGPFQLGKLAKGEIEELPAGLLRSQLGKLAPDDARFADAKLEFSQDNAHAKPTSDAKKRTKPTPEAKKGLKSKPTKKFRVRGVNAR